MPAFAGRVGLFGGTFSPVHIGHLRPAIEVAERLGLRRVDFLPSAMPPHKIGGDVMPFDVRVGMLRAAIEGEPLLGVCTLERDLPSPSYTWNTAVAWAGRHGGRPLFIVGDVDFAQWGAWYNGLRLPEVADFVVTPRSGSDLLFRRCVGRFWPGARPVGDAGGGLAVEAAGGTCLFLPVPKIELSSTEVRAKLRRGESLRYLVPDGVVALLEASRVPFGPVAASGPGLTTGRIPLN